MLLLIFLFILFLFVLIINFSVFWADNYFSGLNIDKILFHINAPIQGTGQEILGDFITSVMIPSLLIFLVTILIFYIGYNSKSKYYLKISNDKNSSTKKILLWPIGHFKSLLSVVILLLFSFIIIEANNRLFLFDYIRNQLNRSNFIAEHYVEPSDQNITFPETKQNLVFIYLESMENTFGDTMSGGAFEDNYIPELTALAENNLTFSNDDNVLGGTLEYYSTGWTIASLFAHSTGLPLKTPIRSNDFADQFDQFFPGAISIGEILNNNGYSNTFMIGSDVTFGNRDKFYEQHGDYNIIDYEYALDNSLIPADYNVWWGYEDRKLFEFAKDELLFLSDSDNPFNFTLLTADTHHEDGYLDEYAAQSYSDQYANVLADSSKQVDEFVQWIQNQDFYENTSIILVGDHLTMDSDFLDSIDGSYQRTLYNTIINPALTTEEIDNNRFRNRHFTPYDWFPTTLATIGVEINGERLGLGTNLYSDKPTLLEEYDSDFYEELSKKSTFFNDSILND